MKALTKVLVLGGGAIAFAAGIVAAASARGMVALRRTTGASAQDAHSTTAGTMSVGPLDEVELGAGLARPTRPNVEPEGFDPEEVPSEYAEINELRNKMPFG